MRRFFQFCGILILAFVIFAISTDTTPSSMQRPERPVFEPVPTPAPVIHTEEKPVHATIQYGIPEVIKDNNGPLYTYIRFPQGGNRTDGAISNWVQNLYNTIYAEFQYGRETEPGAIGEINVHFDSYLVDNRYAGIIIEGEYSISLDPSEPPTEILKIFNIDLLNNSFLESTDILDQSQSDSILELLRIRTIAEHPDTERHLGFIDVSWLNLLVIGNDGIIVVLDKYRLLPSSFDTLTVTLPYDDLGNALLIRNEPPLDAVPMPSPTPDPNEIIDPEETENQSHDDDPEEPEQEQEEESEPEQTVARQSGRIDQSKPMIALTLDDGPGVYTEQFLDLFEKYGVRATFCVIGNLVSTQEDALVRAVDMGNEVIGHSWNHKNLAKLSADQVKKQITDTNDIIEDITGSSVKLFRPPYGAVSDTMREASGELGFAMIYWSIDPEDWRVTDPNEIFNTVMSKIDDGSIILSHEIFRSSLVAYERLIPELLSHGYQFVTVSELLRYKFIDLEPGDVYPMMR